jgi:hypothetical protein
MGTEQDRSQFRVVIPEGPGEGAGQAEFSGLAVDDLYNDVNSQSAHFEDRSPSGALLMRAAERWLEDQASEWWLEDYRVLRQQGWKWKDAFCITWLSLRKGDRGTLPTVESLADWLGISRRWFYNRRAKFDGQPGPGQNLWDVTAEHLQLRRLRGSRLAEVDQVTFEQAASAEKSTARDRELYYKRAGVWTDEKRVQVVGDGGGPVDFTDVSDEELEAIRAALQSDAVGGGETG